MLKHLIHMGDYLTGTDGEEKNGENEEKDENREMKEKPVEQKPAGQRRYTVEQRGKHSLRSPRYDQPLQPRTW